VYRVSQPRAQGRRLDERERIAQPLVTDRSLGRANGRRVADQQGARNQQLGDVDGQHVAVLRAPSCTRHAGHDDPTVRNEERTGVEPQSCRQARASSCAAVPWRAGLVSCGAATNATELMSANGAA
jgi:hypothetical protein